MFSQSFLANLSKVVSMPITMCDSQLKYETKRVPYASSFEAVFECGVFLLRSDALLAACGLWVAPVWCFEKLLIRRLQATGQREIL